MSGDVSVKVVGADALAASLRSADRGLADMSGPSAAAAALLASAATRRAPRRTGTQAGSIRATSGRSDAEVAAGVSYARFSEYGTRYMPARPFMRPALTDSADQVTELYAAHARQVLSSVKGA